MPATCRDRIDHVRLTPPPLYTITTNGEHIRLGAMARLVGGSGGRDQCGPYFGIIFLYTMLNTEDSP